MLLHKGIIIFHWLGVLRFRGVLMGRGRGCRDGGAGSRSLSDRSASLQAASLAQSHQYEANHRKRPRDRNKDGADWSCLL